MDSQTCLNLCFLHNSPYMKFLLCLSTIAILALSGCVSGDSSRTEKSASKIVDAGCGQCLLGLKGKKGCDLAVRLDGKSYFVDGFTMKQLGNAHADDGMCNTLRKAKVSGEVVDNRFQARSFDLLPMAKH